MPILSLTTSIVQKSNSYFVFVTSWGEGRHACVYRHAASAMEAHELQAQPITSRLDALLANDTHDALQSDAL
ncbi:hypothetical protein ASF64_13140 [Arthrobacter sp. Leaf137]|nr:hypothetical protein ASF64_13140 [Arthrobacter sp. Leaf137]